MSDLNEIIRDVLEIKSDRATLKKFGMTMGIVFLLIAALQTRHQNGYAVPFAGASGFFLVFGFFAPMALKPVQKVWMALAVLMGCVMTRVILFVLFFLIVVPVALVARISGKQFLDRYQDKNKESYWILRPQGKIEKSRYENQF